MSLTRFHLVLLTAVAAMAVQNVASAQMRFSAAKQGKANVSGNFSPSRISGKSFGSGPSARRGAVGTGIKSQPVPKLGGSLSGKTLPKLGGSNVSQMPTSRSSALPKSGAPKVQPFPKPTIDFGRIRSSGPSNPTNPTPKFDAGRLGNLSNLKNLDGKDLDRAKQLGWIQGPGSVEGLKDLASRIEGGKMASGSLHKLGRDQFKHILNLGGASMSPAHKGAAIEAAKKYCGLGTHCHWWFDVICGSHWHHHGCQWDYWCYPVYWKSWTPCNWHVVYCPSTAAYQSVAYYFGVEGVIIPDTAAFGIHEVKPGSPAERYGLQPGMIIVSVNGQAMTSDAVMVGAIQTSGGRLDLEVLAQGSDQPQRMTVILDLVPRTAF